MEDKNMTIQERMTIQAKHWLLVKHHDNIKDEGIGRTSETSWLELLQFDDAAAQSAFIQSYTGSKTSSIEVIVGTKA